jgi:two-component system sensor histidine kinase SenX3
MRLSRRRPAIVLTILMGVCLAGLAITLNVGWIVLNWRELLPLVLGIPLTLLLVAGVVVNTVFLVREMRRNDQQDSFLNAVTHELKTPIASIRLYLETLQQRPVPEEKRQEFYRIMLEDNDRLLATVEQVLKAGEVTQRHRSGAFETVDLADLAQDVVTRALQRNHLSAHAIVFDRPAASLPVNGSPEDLQTAIGNLLSNALKYSTAGAAVHVHVFRDEDGAACLQVVDQGIGIAPDQIKRIFKRFYRVPVRAVLHRKGTGLGLFLVRSIVKQHGGQVAAASKGEGHGATFTMRLPAIPDSPSALGTPLQRRAQT